MARSKLFFVLALAVVAFSLSRLTFAEEPTVGSTDLTEVYSFSENAEEVSETWEMGYAFVPGSATREFIYGRMKSPTVRARLIKLPIDIRFPVIVYLHDAGGISKKINILMEALNFEKFAMVLPDSYARTGRRSDCQGNVANPKNCAMSPDIYLSRRSELIHAVAAVKRLPWVDEGNVYLMGSGEGAVTIALWGGEVDVSGYILVDWTCTAPNDLPWFNGLRTPNDRPTLVLMPRDHRWANMPGWDGDCSDKAEDHLEFESLNIDSAIRNVFEVPKGMQATIRFLRAHKS